MTLRPPTRVASALRAVAISLVVPALIAAALVVTESASRETVRPRSGGLRGVAAPVVPPGPPLLTDQRALDRAIRCTADLTEVDAPTPVLLVHGAGGTSEEAWSQSWRPELVRLGHPVCTVDLPLLNAGDVQHGVEYVVNAVRRVAAYARRPVSVVGLSLGALEVDYALRLWPDLGGLVDDVVGLAGVYLPGSDRIADICARPEGCVPALHQIESGADLLDRLADWPLPAGVDVSLLATLEDRTVTPQPAANRVVGATSVHVEQVCPDRGRRFALSHATFVGDAVAHRLLLDALDHPGPADPARVDPAVCDLHYFPGFDLEAHQQAQNPGRPFRTATTPPATRCYLSRDCRDAASRGEVAADQQVRVTGRRVVYSATVLRAGTIELTLAGQRTARSVTPGRVRISLLRPRITRPRGDRVRRPVRRHALLEVTTGLPRYTARAEELRVRVPVRGPVRGPVRRSRR